MNYLKLAFTPFHISFLVLTTLNDLHVFINIYLKVISAGSDKIRNVQLFLCFIWFILGLDTKTGLKIKS